MYGEEGFLICKVEVVEKVWKKSLMLTAFIRLKVVKQ